MDDGNALPAPVIALLRDLECVLGDARARLDALVSLAVPEQDDGAQSAAAAPRVETSARSGLRSVVG